jgi:hypothetical protein
VQAAVCETPTPVDGRLRDKEAEIEEVEKLDKIQENETTKGL